MTGIMFPRSKKFYKLEWECLNISSTGLTLQTNFGTSKGFFARFKRFIKPFLFKSKSKKKIRLESSSSTESLKVVVEIKIPGTDNIVVLSGKLVWFRSLWEEVYVMGIQFDDPSRVVVYDDGASNICITTYFPSKAKESSLPK